MTQSDINYLYQLLTPWYELIRFTYTDDVSIQFQRMVRMIAEGDTNITLDGKRSELSHYHALSNIVQKGNRVVFNHEQFDATKPVEMKHIFASLRSISISIDEEMSTLPNRIAIGYLEGRDSFMLRSTLQKRHPLF